MLVRCYSIRGSNLSLHCWAAIKKRKQADFLHYPTSKTTNPEFLGAPILQAEQKPPPKRSLNLKTTTISTMIFHPAAILSQEQNVASRQGPKFWPAADRNCNKQ